MYKQRSSLSIDWSVKRSRCNAEICSQCALDPKCHSIYIRGTGYDSCILIYTQPAEAKMYDDHNGIENHFRGLVSTLGTSPWVWVFDAKDLGWKHALDPRSGIRLARFFSECCTSSLKGIYILNGNYLVSLLLTIVWPFLDPSLRQKIVWLPTGYGEIRPE